MTFKEFLESKVGEGKDFDSIADNGDGTYTLVKDGYEVTVNEEGIIGNVEKSGGVVPQIETNFYTEAGEELKEGESYTTVILTVNVTNEVGNIDEITVKTSSGKEINKETNVTGTGKASYKVSTSETYTITVKATTEGATKQATVTAKAKVAPTEWKATTATDSSWYSYGGKKISGPKLVGEMTPIVYTGTIADGENKWANAITADGSMWVWIPRYAYKITEGYHTNTAGTIQIAFLDTNNNFLNSSDTGTIKTNPSDITYTETDGKKVQNEWLVHPAFSEDASIGGGFGSASSRIAGIWVGKFEATGTIDAITVKPGVKSIRSQTIGAFYKAAKQATYGESVTAETLGSHMAKNSEWGAAAYLGQSTYGAGTGAAGKVERNTSNDYTGGSSNKVTIYSNSTNKTYSTTHNATGIYDMSGHGYEYVASYSNNGSSKLTDNGGTAEGDLYGATADERATSTKYKMVYEGTGTSTTDYETAKKYKGDAVYETSSAINGTNSWHGANAYFPYSISPFFVRGGDYNNSNAGSFYFSNNVGNSDGYYSFRPVLAF